MELKTAAEVIGFIRKIEDESAKYYENLAQLYAENSELFLTLATENRKFAKQIEQAYYGVISDALEGCFAFNIEVDDYALETGQAQRMTYQQAINEAIQIEEKAARFYSVAAEQSKPFLADVPRALAAVAKKRNERQYALKELLGKAAG